MIIVRIRAPQSRPVSFVASTRRATLGASGGKWTAATVVHCEEAAFVIGMTRRPQLAHDCHVFGAVLVPPLVMLGARPNAHLRVFAPLPARDDVHSEAAMRDAVNRHRHAGGDRRRHSENGAGGGERVAPHKSATGSPTHRSLIFSACFSNFSANSISADLT